MRKTKSLFGIILTLAISFALTLLLVACKPQHEHSFGNWKVVSPDEAPCHQRQYEQRCECGEIQTKIGNESDHVWRNEYTHNRSNHWYDCQLCDEKKDFGAHNAAEYLCCLMCGETGTSNLTYELTQGGESYIVTSYGGYDEDVIIPSMYDGLPVTSIADEAFYENSRMESVVIGDNVTSIGERAFYGCKNLYFVEMKDGVTSIGERAFYGCKALATVVIGNGLEILGNHAFQDCINLINIEFPSSLTSIGDYAFERCRSLTNLEFPSSLTSIGDHAFESCNLADLSLPNTITSIGDYAFYYCRNLLTVEFPNSLTSIGDYAFFSCDKIIGVTFPSSLTSVGDYAFWGSYIEDLVIPQSLTNIGEGAFSAISSLLSITVEQGNSAYKTVDDCLYTIDGKTLVLCATGKEDDVFFVPEDVEIIDAGAFYGYEALETIELPQGLKQIGKCAFAGCTSLANIDIPSTIESVGEEAFSGCESLPLIAYHGGNYLGNVDDPYLILIEAVDENIDYCVVSTSTKFISYDAFYVCYSMPRLYYKGSESEWNEVDCVEWQSTYAYFYSETEPAQEGNYWYYDEDGEIKVWGEE